MSQQKITEKVLSLLEYLDSMVQNQDHPNFHTQSVMFKKIRRKLDEISLESFAEINKPEDENN